ncbi:MAG: hypothetical protein ACUZ77_02285 [Candidatus Brocadiales bacterium]
MEFASWIVLGLVFIVTVAMLIYAKAYSRNVFTIYKHIKLKHLHQYIASFILVVTFA